MVPHGPWPLLRRDECPRCCATLLHRARERGGVVSFLGLLVDIFTETLVGAAGYALDALVAFTGVAS